MAKRKNFMSPVGNFKSSSIQKKTLSSLSALLFDQLTCGIYFADVPKRKFLFVNEELANLTGIKREVLNKLGLTCYIENMFPADSQLLSLELLPRLSKLLKEASKQNFSLLKYSVNYRFKVGSGEIKYFIHHTTLLEFNEKFEPRLALAYISDVSHYKTDNKMIFQLSGFNAEKGSWELISDQVILHEPKFLSKREVEIMRMIVNGTSQKSIADQLHISYYTVRAHCRHILEKIDCKKLEELKARCIKEGWA